MKELAKLLIQMRKQKSTVISLFDALKPKQELPRVKVSSDCIPEFSPQNTNLNVHQWLMKIDQLKSLNQWDEITTIYHMQSRLVGMAKSWYHSLQNYNLTWDEWNVLVRRSFPDHTDYATLLQTMLNRRKGSLETMTTYYFEKMELLRACDIQGERAVSCLIQGIADVVIQNGARAERYETPKALYEKYLSVVYATETGPTSEQQRPDL
ncbi:hypothetical protein NQ318_023220 [Aromia moschata]|uniref:Retrotransposon gag domain-containing protein n=1 Tax=Aromia moschata TaxID=1265417 RepID=A0AAV8XMM6_9CUCU|nr:hypothetical protein NQ318_023220 [Aromia moschata]